MPFTKRKKKRKKIRYSKITIKLSSRQKKSLVNYCKARKTTPNKLIKKSIKRFINGFDRSVPEEYFITENQLDLFEENEDKKPTSEVGNHKLEVVAGDKPETESQKIEISSQNPENETPISEVNKEKLSSNKNKSNTLTFDF